MNLIKNSIDVSYYESDDVKLFISKYLNGIIDDVMKVKEYKKIVKNSELSRFDKDSLIDELDEIKDDVSFKNKKCNKIILYIDEHGRSLEEKINKKFIINNLMIRAHVSKRFLCIFGYSLNEVSGIEKLVKTYSGFPAKSYIQKSAQQGDAPETGSSE